MITGYFLVVDLGLHFGKYSLIHGLFYTCNENKDMWYDCLWDRYPKHVNYKHIHVAIKPPIMGKYPHHMQAVKGPKNKIQWFSNVAITGQISKQCKASNI